ncbi:hypothetical protein P8825_14470 [Shouchella clausii]|uniref:hypothetical protein n=1 Tax=Shouchella clausii TaxID=79880 RepID=UPI002DBEF55A|nr:hypothetical protein [Shouchella clausii]MEB5480769.1 hypothetical protein [Shouchella clausii]
MEFKLSPIEEQAIHAASMSREEYIKKIKSYLDTSGSRKEFDGLSQVITLMLEELEYNGIMIAHLLAQVNELSNQK